MGFFGALCLLLIALKLTGVITTSWLIVLFPFTLAFLFFSAILLYSVAVFAMDKK